MKKIRIFVRIATGVLVVLLIIGVVLLITNDHNINDTIYEIIAFSVGVIGMIMAVVSEIGNSKMERENDSIQRNIREILETNQADLKMTQKILDELKVKPKQKSKR